MPARIAIVTTSFPARSGDASGHFVAAEAQELALAGYEVHVIRPGHGTIAADSGVRLYGVGGGDAFGWPGALARLQQAPWRAPAVLAFLRGARLRLEQLERLGLARIEAHWMIPSAWPVAARRLGGAKGASPTPTHTPLRVTCHGGDVRALCALPAPLRHHIVGRVLERAERVTFVSRQLRAELASALPPRLSERVNDQGVVRAPIVQVLVPDRAAHSAARHRIGDTQDAPCVAVVGRLVAGKRIDLAIRAVAAARLPWRLVVVGDGPDRMRLEGLARELGVELSMTGLLDRESAHATLAACDALLHTSAAEGAPSVIREARVLGVPVVTTPVGDVAAWALRDAGIVVVEPELGALARALDGLLLNRKRPAASVRLPALS